MTYTQCAVSSWLKNQSTEIRCIFLISAIIKVEHMQILSNIHTVYD